MRGSCFPTFARGICTSVTSIIGRAGASLEGGQGALLEEILGDRDVIAISEVTLGAAND
jgi:hypothetical protein